VGGAPPRPHHRRPASAWRSSGRTAPGKTTITKLLARLYDPTEGRILLDGRDLREWDLASLRAAVGVIFQDFVRYDLRLDENIGVGEIGAVRASLDAAADGTAVDGNGSVEGAPHPRIAEAAERSLAASLLARLPGGYRQMLGRRFEQGVDLSGGEWQKVALARAYLRDAQLLILDEPTAALDARAEYEVFARFSELVAGAHGGARVAPLLHRAHGRPHRRARARARGGVGDARGARGARRDVRGAVRVAGGGVPVSGAGRERFESGSTAVRERLDGGFRAGSRVPGMPRRPDGSHGATV
jgi:ABC-type polar amino acid transport system ATPase subunit